MTTAHALGEIYQGLELILLEVVRKRQQLAKEIVKTRLVCGNDKFAGRDPDFARIEFE